LDKYAGKNSLIIDLAWNIGAMDIITWCHDNKTLYVNTSVELWDPYKTRTYLKKLFIGDKWK